MLTLSVALYSELYLLLYLALASGLSVCQSQGDPVLASLVFSGRFLPYVGPQTCYCYLYLFPSSFLNVPYISICKEGGIVFHYIVTKCPQHRTRHLLPYTVQVR